MKRICSILILIVLLLNSSVMVLISQAVETVSEILSTGENNIQSTQEIILEKYINYATEQERGTMVQLNVKVGLQNDEINSKKEIFIKNTSLSIECPKILEKLPTRVEVIRETIGEVVGETIDKSEDKEVNYENGIITIQDTYAEKLKYEDKKSYTVVLFYDADCYTNVNAERTLDVKVSATQTVSVESTTSSISTVNTDKDIVINGEKLSQIVVNENVGTIVSVDYATNPIYNGYINSNIENGTAYETEYKEITKVMISNKNIAETFIVESNNAFKYQEQEISNNMNLLYKNLIIERNKVEDILGANGEIRILGEDNRILDVINNEVEAGEDGKYAYTFAEPIESVKLQISNIAKEGIIEFNTTKVIKPTLVQNVDTIKNTLSISGIRTNEITNIDEETQQEVISEETNTVYVENLENNITIQNATKKISMNVNKQEITNNAQNELTITATLEKNNPQNKLFENPTIFVELPEEVEKVILKDVQVVHDQELTKQEQVVETNAEGKQVIKIGLTGKQTQYTQTEDISKGTNILISATIILKQDITSKDSSIKMICDENTYEQVIKIIDKNQVTTKTPTTGIEGEVTNANGLKIDTKAIAGDKILANNETVYEQQILKYEVKLTNTTDKNIENIKIVGKVPEGMTYVDLVEGTFYFEDYRFVPNDTIKQKEIEIATLIPGQTMTYYYEVKVNDLLDTEEEKETNSEVKVYVADTEVSTYTLTNTIAQAEIAVELGGFTNRAERNQWVYYAKISNISSEVQQNVKVSIPFSDNLQIKEANVWDNEENYKININNNILSVELNTVKIKGLVEGDDDIPVVEIPDEDGEHGTIGIVYDANEIIVFIIADIINFEEGDNYLWNINTSATVTTQSGKVYKSNENRASGNIEAVQVNQSSDKTGETLKAEDEITYTFNVTSLGNVEDEWGGYTEANLKDYIPNELEVLSVDYTSNTVKEEIIDGKIVYTLEPLNRSLNEYEIQLVNEKDNTEDARIDLNLNIKVNETSTVTIRARARKVWEDTQIQNYAIVTGKDIKTKKSNIIQNTIKKYETIADIEDPKEPEDPDKPIDPDNPDNPDEPKKYTISGLAWIDENENGQREETEQRLSGIEVMLLDVTNNKYLQDESGRLITKVTNNNGQYSFENINEGKYYAIFKYNNKDYEITTYKKPGISVATNSDAMQSEAIINNQKLIVGLTDIIELKSNKTNIDIGLIKNKIFDLKVDKYIQKITVQNNKGTKQYNYNNEKIAKVEIPANQIVGSTLVLEYAIVVTNVGELAGTVNELIDQMPTNLEFNSELNSNWYKTAGNNLSNTKISTEEIKPGESLKTTIVLTKTLDENIETYTNIAKIGISDNIKHFEDKNIQNDTDKVDVIISVKTGSVSEYIGTVIGAILTIAIMLIIVIVLINKNKGTSLKILCFVLVMFLALQIKTSISADGVMPPVEHDGITIVINSYKDKDYQAIVNGITYQTVCQTSGAHYCSQCSMHTETENFVTGIPYGMNVSGSDINLNINNNVGPVTFKNVGDRDIYGPFQVLSDCSMGLTVQGITDTSNAPTSIAYKILGEDGQTEISGISSGRTFYLSVPSSVRALTNVSVTASTSKEITYNVDVTYDCMLVPDAVQPPHKNTVHGSNTYGQIITSGSQVQVHKLGRMVYTDTIKENSTISKSVNWTLPKTIRTVKVDYDNNAKVLPNVKFILKNEALGRYVKQNTTDFSITYVVNEADATVFTTDATGTVQIKGLNIGEYTFIEKENPYHGYDNIKNINNVRKIPIISSNSLVNYTARNKTLLGTLDLEKINNVNTAIKLNDVEFILLDHTGTKYLQIEIEGKTGLQTGSENKVRGTAKVTKQQYTTNSEEATIFVTDENGKIHIENIALESPDTNINNNTVYQHIIKEIYNPHYGYEIDPDYITWKVNGIEMGVVNSQLSFTIPNKGTANVTSRNEQKYARISGYVWEDMPEGKDNLRDDLYNSTGNDVLVEGIKVILHNTKTGKTFERWTDNKGAYLFGSKEGEKYSEDNILLRDIDYYYMEFIYNGMKYTNVIPQTAQENGSKTSESISDRTQYNNKFSTIIGSTEKGTIGEGQTQGYALDENGNTTTDIYYTQPEEHKSEITYTEKQEYADSTAGVKLNDYYAVEKYRISATTQSAGHNIRNSYVVDNEEIKNINLGLYQREQVDLALSSDIEDLQVSLNGYTHTYHYATRNQYVKNDGAFNVGVKFGDKYLNRYSRTIYQSSVSYFAEDRENNKLEVNMVYKITMKNESSTLTSTFNQINNYYDKEYTPQEVYRIVGGVKTPITSWSIGNQTYVNGKFNVLEIMLGDQYVSAGEIEEIYIRYRVSDEAVLGLLNVDSTLDNMTEICSYSTYKKTAETTYEHYASIDEDSAVNNVVVELDENDKFIKTTFEDDTDMAPSIVLQAQKNNIISGTVFEDSQTQESKSINERLGNGIYEEETENVVVNARVELLEAYDDNDNVDESLKGTIKTDSEGNPIIATLYQSRIGEDGEVEKLLVEAVTYTDDNGNYEFVGLIPDGYVVRYIYGEGTKIRERGTSNYTEIDVRDYKSTIITSPEIRKALNIQIDSTKVEGRGNYNWNTIQEKDENGNIIRYSDAVDEIAERITKEQEEDIIKNSTEQEKPQDMIARTAAFIVGVEFENINASSNVYYKDLDGNVVIDEDTGEPMVDPTYYIEDKYIDFGIIFRPLVEFVVDKNLTNMTIQLANGQMIVNGNPYEQDLPYTRAIEDNIYVDMDADLIQGSALNMEYEVKLINNSEVDYKYTKNDAKGMAGRRYYYFGDSTGAEKIDKYIRLVGDYLDGEVVYDINEMNEGLIEGWEETTAQKLYEEGRIEKDVRDNLIEGKYNIFTTIEYEEGLETSSNPHIATSKTLRFKVSKLLGARDELVFTNDAEILELYATARGSTKVSTPGNLIPQKAQELDEDSVIMIIMPPTGGNDYIGYIITIIGSLLIVIAGVILVKKKVGQWGR